MGTYRNVKRAMVKVVAVALGMTALAAVGTFATPAQADEPQVAPAAAGVVNINTATPQQLGLLPGIGETKARAIVEHRTRRPFARVEEIVSVRGIGRATLRRLRPYLTVRGDTTLTHAVAIAHAPATPAANTPTKAAPQPARPAARR